MEDWLQDKTNSRHVDRLRELLASGEASLFIFLGAGLSFGASRQRALFEESEYDDGYRFPSWTQLVRRMEENLLSHPVLKTHEDSVRLFFKEQGPLNCAELFWHYTQGPNYWDFLKSQFGSKPEDSKRLTRSHHELTRLPVTELFTTNYDDLIEAAYRTRRMDLRVSSSPREFLDNVRAPGEVHLIKLHGTIRHPDTIVLTRSDYARSRHERSEMFHHLQSRFQHTTFLFIGFSLTDPNFTILFDEARYIRQGQNPVSYLVQGRSDSVRDAYLSSLGINPITLGWWDLLPEFLEAINPTPQSD